MLYTSLVLKFEFCLQVVKTWSVLNWYVFIKFKLCPFFNSKARFFFSFVFYKHYTTKIHSPTSIIIIYYRHTLNGVVSIECQRIVENTTINKFKMVLYFEHSVLVCYVRNCIYDPGNFKDEYRYKSCISYKKGKCFFF